MLRHPNANPCSSHALDRGVQRHSTRCPIRWRVFGWVIVGALLLTVPAAATILTVGTDIGDCDFTDLATAIGAAVDGDVLHLQAMTFLGATNSNFNINTKSLTLEGGYADCNAASSTGTSTLSGGGSDSVVEINGNGSHAILLQHLVITGGEDDPDDGGGLEIDGPFAVTLLDVEISGNSSELGAGIHLNGADGASLFLGEGSTIRQNDAAIDGGGIYCVGGATVEIQAPASIEENTAARDGGGLWIGDACQVEFYTDEAQDLITEVRSNRATRDGGGLFIAEGAGVVGHGGKNAGVQIAFNTAGFGAGLGLGGGVYVSDQDSRLDLDRGLISFNIADQGGGLYVDNDAEASLHSDGPCTGGVFGWCSIIALNESPLAGGLAVSNGASADLELTLVAGNGPGAGLGGDAPIATVANGGNLVLKGSVVSRNGIDVGTASGGIVDTGGFVSADGTTFSDNYGSDHLFWVGGSFSGQSSLFDVGASAGDLFNVQTSGSWSLDCALIAPGLSVPAGGTNISIGDALLRNPAEFDFHLSAGSPAIDLCPGTPPALAVDFDRDPRPLGLAPDAGADEYDPPLFADGFETGDTTAWSD